MQQHICRGATISGGAEIYSRQVYDMFVSGSGGGESTPPAPAEPRVGDNNSNSR